MKKSITALAILSSISSIALSDTSVNMAVTCSLNTVPSQDVSIVIENSELAYHSTLLKVGEFYSTVQMNGGQTNEFSLADGYVSNYFTVDNGRVGNYFTVGDVDIITSFNIISNDNETPNAWGEVDGWTDEGDLIWTAEYSYSGSSCTRKATHRESVIEILAEGIINLANLGDRDISAAGLQAAYPDQIVDEDYYSDNPSYGNGEPYPALVMTVPSAFALDIAAKRTLNSFPRELTSNEKVILDNTIIAKLHEINPNAEIPTVITATTSESSEVSPADEGGNGSMGLLLMFLPLIRKIIK